MGSEPTHVLEMAVVIKSDKLCRNKDSEAEVRFEKKVPILEIKVAFAFAAEVTEEYSDLFKMVLMPEMFATEGGIEMFIADKSEFKEAIKEDVAISEERVDL